MNKQPKILIVDDEPDTVEVLSRRLISEKYKVIKVYSGIECIELLKKYKPDLILMDVMMPGMDGFQTIKIIREKVREYIPIIIVTATKDDTESIKTGLDSGADDYISIPCEKEELLARIRAMLRIKELNDKLSEKNKRLDEAHSKIKETHEELVHAAKMAALGRFTASAAHEINNPLSIVSGNAQYILEALKGKKFNNITERDFRELKECVNIIMKYSDRCGNIAGNLLRFGHKKRLNKRPTNINDVFNNVFTLMGNQLNLSNIKIIKDMDPELPVIKADPSRLEQVFMNLILNAKDAMPKRGMLRVMTYRGEIAKDKNIRKRMVIIEIIDTGSGISRENLDKIFDPFFTTKNAGAGTGLGLSIAYSIIKNHKGEISVKSELGKGTSFTIKLPVD